MDVREFTISWGALWKILVMVILVAVLFAAREILIAAFLAIIISSALAPAVNWLEGRRIPRILGTIAIYILMIFIVAAMVYVVLPIFLVELNLLLTGSNQFAQSIFKAFSPTGEYQEITSAISQTTTTLLGGKINFLDIVSKFLGGVLITIIIFVLSFYLTLGRQGVDKFFTTILPYKYQHGALDIYQRIRLKINRWLGGQLILSVIVGLAVFIGLSILNVRYALILGFAAAVLELIPYVGPIFSGLLAVLVAASQSSTLALYTLILFILIQQLESHFLIPSVVGLTTELSPVVVILALLIGGKIFGLIGIILAVPFAVLFSEILRAWPISRAPSTTANM